MCFRQLTRRDAAVVVVLQGAQGDGAEDFLRCGELRQQPLEVAGAVEAPAQLVGEHRLGGARRPDEQHVLPGEQRGERAVDHLGALEEQLCQFFPNAPEPVPSGHTRRC